MVLACLCRVKALTGARPHNQADADGGGDLGKPDNGPKLRAPGAGPGYGQRDGRPQTVVDSATFPAENS